MNDHRLFAGVHHADARAKKHQEEDAPKAARSLGAPGVALFSYGALNSFDYWDDLANGPFAITATVPKPNWKP